MISTRKLQQQHAITAIGPLVTESSLSEWHEKGLKSNSECHLSVPALLRHCPNDLVMSNFNLNKELGCREIRQAISNARTRTYGNRNGRLFQDHQKRSQSRSTNCRVLASPPRLKLQFRFKTNDKTLMRSWAVQICILLPPRAACKRLWFYRHNLQSHLGQPFSAQRCRYFCNTISATKCLDIVAIACAVCRILQLQRLDSILLHDLDFLSFVANMSPQSTS